MGGVTGGATPARRRLGLHAGHHHVQRGALSCMILWRIVQGIGGAFLFANAAALVTDAFPREELGLAMGTNTMVAAVGLVLGPVLGGALVSISWHWVFWFNVPFGLMGATWGALVLHEL